MVNLTNNGDRNYASITGNASTTNSMMVLFGIIFVLGAGILAFSDSSFDNVSFNTSAFAQVSDPLPPPVIVSSIDNTNALELDGATGVTHVVIDGTTYALVTGNADNGLQIIDISNPSSPNPVSSFTSADFEAPVGVDTAVIDGDTFAIVGVANSDDMIILNITDPTVTPTVRNATDFNNLRDGFVQPTGISIFVDDGFTYAVVADTHGEAIRIANITDTASPGPFFSVTNGTVIDGRTFIIENPHATSIVTIAGDRYAVVAHGSSGGPTDGIHIVNITTPSNPFFVSNVTDTPDLILGNVRDVDTYVIDGKTYAVAAAAFNDGIQIIDISDPLNPAPMGSLVDGAGGVNFASQTSIETLVSGGNTYAVVTGTGATTSGGFGHFHIINITDPADPTHVHNIINDGAISSSSLQGVDIADIGGIQYALVARSVTGPTGDGFVMVQLTDRALTISDTPVLSDTAVVSGALRLTPSSTPTLSDDIITLGSFARAASSTPTLSDMAVSVNPDTVSASTTPTLLDTADVMLPDAPFVLPPPPTPADTLVHGNGLALDGAISVDTIIIDGRTYAVTAANQDTTGGIQIIDITDPDDISGVSRIQNADEVVLTNAFGVTTTFVNNIPYALVVSTGGDNGGLAIFDISTPTTPMLVFNVTGTEADAGLFSEIQQPRYITTIDIGTDVFAIVTGFLDDGAQIINITDPSDPTSFTAIGHGTDYLLENPRAVSAINVGTNTYAAIVSYDHTGDVPGTSSLQIVEITSTGVTPLDSIPESADVILEAPRGVDTITIGDDTYVIVTSQSEDGIQIFNMNDPADLSIVSNVTDTDDLVLDGARSITTTSVGNNVYAIVTSVTDDGVQIIDITDPINPEPTYAINNTFGDFADLSNPSSVVVEMINGVPYIVVADNVGDIVHVINMFGSADTELSTDVTSPTGLTDIPFTVTFTEDVTDFVVSDVRPSTGTADEFVPVSASEYTFIVTGITDPDTLTLQIMENVAMDGSGAGNARSNLISLDLDRVLPTIDSAVALDATTIQLTLSKPVTNNGTVGGDFALSGVASTNTFDGTITVSDDGNTITLTLSGANRIVSEDRNTATTVTYTPNTDGTNLLDVAENPIATTTIPVTIEDLDFVAPTVTLTTAVSSPTNLTTIPFTVSFSEPVNEFTIPEDVIVNSGVVQDLRFAAQFDHTFGSMGTSEVVGSQNIFNEPSAVHINASGHIFVADQLNHRVLILDSLGGYLSHLGTTGTSGTGSTTLNAPLGVTTNSSGHILVANTGNNTVAIFDSSGNYQDIIDATFTAPTDIVTNSSGHIFVADGLGTHLIRVFDSSGENPSSFNGGDGTSPDTFSFPGGIAINSTDHIFVSNTGRHTVYVLDSDGNYLTHLGTNDTAGTDNASFDGPVDLTFDRHDNLYISDSNNNRIQVYNSSLSYQYTMSGDSSDEAPAFNIPQGIAINSTGFAHIADNNNVRIQVYDTNAYSFEVTDLNHDDTLTVDIQMNVVEDLAGNSNPAGVERISIVIDTTVPTVSSVNTIDNSTIRVVFSESISNNGTVPGDYTITGVASGSQIGGVTALEGSSDNIMILQLVAGNYIERSDDPDNISITYTPNVDGTNIVDPAGNPVATFTESISVDSYIFAPLVTITTSIDASEAAGLDTIPFTISFSEPVIGFDPALDVMVSLNGNAESFESSISHQRNIGQHGNRPGQLNIPVGITVNATGHIFVVDNDNHRLQIFDPRGNYLAHVGGPDSTENSNPPLSSGAGGASDGQFETPNHIAINSTGFIYIADHNNDRVQILDPNLNFVDRFDYNNPFGIAIDSSDMVYVTNSTGNDISVYDTSNTRVATFNGATDGARFNFPSGIAFHPTMPNRLYVADTGNDHVRVFDINDNYRQLSQFNGNATVGGVVNSANELDAPRGLAIDAQNNLYVSSNLNNRVLVFDALTHDFISEVTGGGGFSFPNGIALHEPTGSVYIADSTFHRIQVYGPSSGTFDVTGFDSTGTLQVSLPADTVHDLDGIPNAASDVSSLVIDGTAPTIINAVASSINTIHLTMSEPVSNNGTVPADYTLTGVTGASIGAISLSSNGTILTLTLTGGLIESDDTPTIVYTDNSPTSNILDAAENPLATRTITVTGIHSLDFTPPVITLSSITASPTNRGTIPFTVSFDKPVSGFTLDDVEAFATGRIAHQFSFGDEGMENGNFTSPRGIAVNPVNNNIYVADYDQHRVQIFDSEGTYIDQIGTTGTSGAGNNQFNLPTAVAFNSSGHVFVSDFNNIRVQIFDPSHVYQHTIGTTGTVGSINGLFNIISGVTTNSSGHIFVGDALNYRVQIFDSNADHQLNLGGTVGSGPNQFDAINDIAINSTGFIYVADAGTNNRISVFDSSGNPVARFGHNTGGGNNLNVPLSLTFDSEDNLYVTDSDNNRIMVFDSSNQFQYRIGANDGNGDSGDGDGEFNTPHGIAFDSAGNIYVVDAENHRVQTFSTMPEATPRNLVHILDHQLTFGNTGTQNGNLTDPRGIAINPINNNIYVADSQNHRIQIFDSEGGYVDQIGTTGVSGDGDDDLFAPEAVAFNSTHIFVADRGNNRIQIYDSSYMRQDTIGTGTAGSGTTQLDNPHYVTTNSTHIFVADYNNHRIQIFDGSGDYQDTIAGTVGNGPNELNFPIGVAINSSGYIYVTNQVGNRISIFDSSGDPVAQFGHETGGGNNLDNPRHLTFDAQDNLYVIDSNNNRILVFDSTNQYQYKVGASNGNGSSGTGEGEFNNPHGIAFDSQYNLHVADDENDRVQIFSTLATGSAFGVTGYPDPATLTVSIPENTVQSIGGLPNTAASNILAFVIDRDRPEHTSISAVSTSRIDIDINENITNNNVDIADFTIVAPGSATAPTVQSIVISPDGQSIQLLLTGDPLDETDNAITLMYVNDDPVTERHFLDAANNTLPNIDPAIPVTNNISMSGPIITLTTDVSDPTNADTITFTVSFDRDTAGFTLADVTISSGVKENFDIVVSPPVHQSTFGSFEASIANGKAADNGKFDNPQSVATNSTGHIFVADYFNNRVQIFDSNNVYQGQIGTTSNSGSNGDNEFTRPAAVHINGSDHIFVADELNHRVQVYDSSNVFQYTLGTLDSSGPGTNQFNTPVDVTTNSTHVFVADQTNHRIQIFDHNEQFVTSINSTDNSFRNPLGVAVNSTGHIFVSEFTGRISIWDGSSQESLGIITGLNRPAQMAFDSADYLYVADSNSNHIRIFDSAQLDAANSVDNDEYYTFNGDGTTPGRFSQPFGVSVDADGILRIVERGGSEVQAFDVSDIRTTSTTFDVTDAIDGQTLTVSIPAGAVQEIGTGTDNVLAASVSRLIDRTAPIITSAVFTGIDTIELTTDEDIVLGNTPTSRFTVIIGGVGGTNITPSAIAVSDDTITLTLPDGITLAQSEDTITLEYLIPAGTDGIQDLATNRLVGFSNAATAITVETGDVNFAVPTVTLSTDSPQPTNESTITITATFDPPTATGLAIGDITVSPNTATVENFVAATNTFDVSGLTTGILNVTIAANAVTDPENNLQNIVTTESFVIDRTAPTASGAVAIAPDEILINFNEEITVHEITAPGDFVITSNLTGTQPTVSTVTMENNNNTAALLTLTGTELAEDTGMITVAYTKTGTAGVNNINDTAGNDLATFAAITVDNQVGMFGPIIRLSTTESSPTDAETIPVTATFTRAPTNFIQSDIRVSSGVITGFTNSTATLYTFNVVNPEDKQTLNVTIAAGAVMDAENIANVRAETLLIVIDRVGPMITSITAPDDIIDGTYGEGSVLDIQVVFDETVSFTSGTDGSSIKLELNINTADSTRLADYISGVDSNTLLFRYTIVANDRSSGDLDVTALTFDSTIANVTDVDGLNADLMTLPGSANSLAGNRNIIVDARAEGPTISARGDTNYIQSSDTSTLPSVITISSSNTNATLVLPDAFMNTATNYTIPDALDVIHTRADGGDITITFEPNTHITGTGFDGQVILPNDLGNDCGELPLGEMGDSNLVSCIQIGLNNGELALSKPVRILLEGQFNNTALFTNDGTTVTEITQECDANSDGTLSDTEADFMAPECHIDDEENDNLIIWTNHFTVFGSSNNDTRSSGGGGGNNGDSTAPSFTTSFDEGTNTISIGDIGIAPDRFATSYTLDAPVTVRTGSTLPITLTLYDNISWKSISHVEICMNKQVSTNQICDSDTKIIWDVTDSGNTENDDGTVITANNLEIIDPNDIIQDVSLVITEVDSHVATFEYDVRFGGAMSESDLQIYAWDSRRNSVSFTVVDAIVVTGTSSGNNNNNNNNNNDRSSSGTGSSGGSGSGGAGTRTTTSTTTPTTTPTTDNDSPQTSTAVSDGASIVTSNGTRITVDNSLPNASFHNEQIKKWAGFSAESITDGEILASFDITDNPAEDIILPSWTKDILGKWAGQDKITAKQVKIALSFMYDSIES